MKSVHAFIILIFGLVVFGCTSSPAEKTPAGSSANVDSPITNVTNQPAPQDTKDENVSDVTLGDPCPVFLAEQQMDEYYACYTIIAREKRQVSYCQKINQSEWKAQCVTNIAEYLKSTSVCESIPEKEFRETCYFSVAIHTQDYLNCQGITIEELRLPCIVYSSATKNASICEDEDFPQEQDLRDNCFAGVSISNRNPLFCEKITNSTTKDDCYLNVARFIQNESLCVKVEDKSTGMSCYLGVAAALRNESICDKIQDEGYKGFCKSLVKFIKTG